jgi:hypothetical protein
MMQRPSLEGVRSCAVAAGIAGESPIGWAIGGFRFLVVEVPLPWPEDAEAAGGMPPGLASLLEDSGWWDPAFEAVAPDPAWSVPGRTRVMLYDRSRPIGGSFTRREFLVPRGDVTDLVRTWRDGADVGAGEPGADRVRDILVCAHGSHDACCGRFGAPIHRLLMDECAGVELRVWRASHTGGHRFAPTLLDLPDGRSWGHLRPGDARAVVDRSVPPSMLRAQYRGLGTLASFQERLVEAELLFQHGWAWTDLVITGEVVEGTAHVYADDHDDPPLSTRVRITATRPATGVSATYEGLVERAGELVTRGECGDEDWDLPSFAVSSVGLVGAAERDA